MMRKVLFILAIIIISTLLFRCTSDDCVMLTSTLLGQGDPVNSELEAIKTFAEITNLSIETISKLPITHISKNGEEPSVYKGVLLDYGYYFEFEKFKYQFQVKYDGKVYNNIPQKVPCPR